METRTTAGREKIAAARASVWSAIFLTLMKGIVGFATGSLGILAEALHSLLDLGAAAMTLFSVSYSERPADSDHHYGHGKIENLSALAEAALLMITCLWIFWEAGRRLLGAEVHLIEASVWGFVVMGTSIGIDWYRSRRLMRMAKKHRSQALEADALHFSSDILSSSVVIFGLIGVKLGYPQADPIAALFVALWVAGITVRLATRSVRDLLDAAPAETADAIKTAVEALEGVESVSGVRVRQAGPKTFADLNLSLDRRMSLAEAHRVTDEAEQAVHNLLPDADVIVHPEPTSTPLSREAAGGPIRDAFQSVAAEMKIQYHHMRLFRSPDGTTALVDLEFPPSLSLKEARRQADALEKSVRDRVPELHDVIAHIDVDYSAQDRVVGKTATPDEIPTFQDIKAVVVQVPGVKGCHEFLFTEYLPEEKPGANGDSSGLMLSIHITVRRGLTVAESHEIALQVEHRLCRRYPELRKVHVHQEAG